MGYCSIVPEIDERPRGDTFRVMVALKTTAKVDRSRTLAVHVPECGMEAGEYEVLVVLDNAAEQITAGSGADFNSWLSRAAGSATGGLTTDAIIAVSRGED
jgi:hypothetical protein